MKLRLLACLLPCLALLPATAPATSAAAPVGSCTVVGTSGPDVLTGTRRADVLCGLGGDDVLHGSGGDDVLLGGSGDDHLVGGPGSDLHRAGRGEDVCAYDAADDGYFSCVYDTQSPVIEELTVVTPEVDVTTESQTAVFRMRVTDDTRTLVRSVTLQNSRADGGLLRTFDAAVVEGDAADGWWEIRVRVPRGFPPGSMRLSVRVEDVYGRWAHLDRSFAVRVVDGDPDVLPEVTLLRPSTEVPVDTRDGFRLVTVAARVVVPDSRVVLRGVDLCLEHVASVVLSTCANAVELVSGDRHDGVWRGQVRLRAQDLPGEWSPLVAVRDQARPDSPVEHVGRWGGGHRWNSSGQGWRPLVAPTDGVVRLTSATADEPPALVSASLPQASLTSPSGEEAIELPVEVEATDAGGSPIQQVAVHLVRLDQGMQRWGGGPSLRLDPDGVWRGSITLRPWYEPARYALVVRIADGRHLRYYGGESAAGVTHLPLLPLPGEADPVLVLQ